jgi:hypothetical protein
MGDLDNTLIIYIWGHNGASMEGTLTGSFNETTFFNGVVLGADQQLKIIEKFGGVEELGGFHTAPHYAAAWAHAGEQTITRFTFAGDAQNVQTTMIPRIIGRSYAIEAELQVPGDGAEGVLVAFADFIGGFALWVDEKVVFDLKPHTHDQTALHQVASHQGVAQAVSG